MRQRIATEKLYWLNHDLRTNPERKTLIFERHWRLNRTSAHNSSATTTHDNNNQSTNNSHNNNPEMLRRIYDSSCHYSSPTKQQRTTITQTYTTASSPIATAIETRVHWYHREKVRRIVGANSPLLYHQHTEENPQTIVISRLIRSLYCLYLLFILILI